MEFFLEFILELFVEGYIEIIISLIPKEKLNSKITLIITIICSIIAAASIIGLICGAGFTFAGNANERKIGICILITSAILTLLQSGILIFAKIKNKS